MVAFYLADCWPKLQGGSETLNMVYLHNEQLFYIMNNIFYQMTDCQQLQVDKKTDFIIIILNPIHHHSRH